MQVNRHHGVSISFSIIRKLLQFQVNSFFLSFIHSIFLWSNIPLSVYKYFLLKPFVIYKRINFRQKVTQTTYMNERQILKKQIFQQTIFLQSFDGWSTTNTQKKRKNTPRSTKSVIFHLKKKKKNDKNLIEKRIILSL